MSPIHVGLANDKGGCGKTTLATHLCWWAEMNQIPTLGITTDHQGNLITRLLDDPRLQAERTYQFGKYVELLYSPHYIPQGEDHDKQLVVWDFPPGNYHYQGLALHMWIAPIDSRDALEGLFSSLAQRSFRVKPGGPGIYALINMYDGSGIEPVEAARDALRATSEVSLWPYDIPDSNPIQRTGEFRKPVWLVKKGMQTKGDLIMQKFCYDVFKRLGLKQKYSPAESGRKR